MLWSVSFLYQQARACGKWTAWLSRHHSEVVGFKFGPTTWAWKICNPLGPVPGLAPYCWNWAESVYVLFRFSACWVGLNRFELVRWEFLFRHKAGLSPAWCASSIEGHRRPPSPTRFRIGQTRELRTDLLIAVGPPSYRNEISQLFSAPPSCTSGPLAADASDPFWQLQPHPNDVVIRS